LGTPSSDETMELAAADLDLTGRESD